MQRVFSTEGINPFDQVKWEHRTAEIKDDKGNVVFEQDGVEVPKFYSKLATDIVASKYFYGAKGTEERESSVRQLVDRVTSTIAAWGYKDGYFATGEEANTFRDELTYLCLNQYGAFNSPVWFNVGLSTMYGIKGPANNWRWEPGDASKGWSSAAVPCEDAYKYPQGSACFIQAVDDDMRDIMALATSEAMLFKYGSGTGTDLSTLRSSRELLAGGGKPSGPVSFMKVYDAVASVVKSGGKTRRAAKMQTLKVHHPDILEFIECKQKEDKKAQALIAAGYAADFNGDAYSSVCFQNANLSVRATDEFMRRATTKEGLWTTREVVSGKPSVEYTANELMDKIAEGTWLWGDPGMQFEDTIQRWHTCKASAPINSSNPCCFVSSTLVSTSEGKIPIGKLAEMDAAGKELPYAFTFDRETGRHTLRRIKHAWCSGETRSLVEVTTDKGLVFRCTPEHNFLTYAGEYIEAGSLTPGTRLRKIARSRNGQRADRRWITLPGEPKQKLQSRWMWEQCHGPIPQGMEVHHKNEDPTDDRLSNFELKSMHEHRSDHSRGLKNGNAVECEDLLLLETWDAIESIPRQTHESAAPVTVMRWNTYIKEHGLDGKVPQAGSPTGGGRIRGMTWAEFTEWVEAQKELVNDRVKSVEPVYGVTEGTFVYDMEVEGTHNFEITAADADHGVVVRNSEYMFIDDSACNLASINLMKFRREDGIFEGERFKAAVRIFLLAQEILVDNVSYPTEKICENSHKFRTLGLGYANLGCLLMSMGLPYDSEAGRDMAAAITALMHGAANVESARVAERMGAFSEFDLNRAAMLQVMELHRQYGERGAKAFRTAASKEVWQLAASELNDAIQLGSQYGYRNAQTTLLAPTGTIAFLMDCDTTGVEPDIALVKYKKLAGGGLLKIVNKTVPFALKALGYGDDLVKLIVDYIDAHDTIEASPLDPDHLPIFDCAFPPANGGRSIHWQGHVRMLAAVTPFLSGAISKTINLPNDATPSDIRRAYYLCWELGIKAAAIYRDGSKGSQPLNTKKDEEVVRQAGRERLPDERQAIVHKFDIQGHEGYLTVGLYPDGRMGEMFVTMAKEGSTIGGLMDGIGTAISIGLQHGVPLETYVKKFAHTRFEPAGFTKNPDIPIAKSITDYLFRWLGMKFLPGYREENAPRREETPPATAIPVKVPYHSPDAPACSECGAITIRNGTCFRCHNCGSSMGCS